MRWRKISEETPESGTQCLCRRDWGLGLEPTYHVLFWSHCAHLGDCWESEDTDEYLDVEYANLWCPIEEVENAMENGICEGSANTAEK